MPTTPIYGFPYPSLTLDPPNGPLQLEALAEAVEAALADIHSPPRAQLRQTVVQSIPSGTYTPLTFTTGEDHDTHGGHSPTVNTSRYTCVSHPGLYQFTGTYTSAVTTLGPYAAGWAKNQAGPVYTPDPGSLLAVPSSGAALHTMCPAKPYQVSLAIGDWVQLLAWQNTGGARDTVITTEHQSIMSVLYLGPN